LIVDNAGVTIGTITKKWNGISKEAFTTADKYVVDIDLNMQKIRKRWPLYPVLLQ